MSKITYLEEKLSEAQKEAFAIHQKVEWIKEEIKETPWWSRGLRKDLQQELDDMEPEINAARNKIESLTKALEDARWEETSRKAKEDYDRLVEELEKKGLPVPPVNPFVIAAGTATYNYPRYSQGRGI